ncbi:unnamed protein product [Dracunculus medinensis]|uniref:Nuclear hormone receptor HR96 n=1 Tax=Dracunculus medinensis TaxID=318479 RepID=A0A0N4UNF8_DRAME|nr:unnamed protein product [Dracunculus medinensis]
MSTPEDPVIHSPPSSLRNGPATATTHTTTTSTTGFNSTQNITLTRQAANTLQIPSADQLDLVDYFIGIKLQQSVTMNLMDGSRLNDNRTNDISVDCGSPMRDNSSEESRRRQKTCRVCGDHATGYNFNVITCESCKAFFRRNALRPKEFKCPYSDDCDINSVSRRFCQKCRLRKCFAVGMKKEWILNEEQLRRRKNSRLNHMQSRTMQNGGVSSGGVGSGTGSTSTANTMLAAKQLINRHCMDQPLASANNLHAIISPPGSNVSTVLSPSPDSPTHNSIIGLPQFDSSADVYESNMMRLQRQQAFAYANFKRNGAGSSALNSPTTPSTSILPIIKNNEQFALKSEPHITMSINEYQALIKAAKAGGILLPLETSSASTTTYQSQQPSSSSSSSSSILPNLDDVKPLTDYTELSVATAQPSLKLTPDMEKKVKYISDIIHDELNVESPEISEREALKYAIFREGEPKLNFQLNSAELRALDIVRDAFACMNEPIEDPRKAAYLKKTNHNPTDILNIMDITMRRLVKMAKKLPAFNDLSQDGKFALLKGGMVEMLTMRGVTRFDMDQQCWKTPVISDNFQVPLEMFDQLKEGLRDQQKDGFLKFCRSLHPDVRNNELLIDLLVLIVLFDANRDTIIDSTDKIIISRHCQEYQALLHRYLESMYGHEARARYENLPESLRILRLVSQNAVTLFLGRVDLNESEALPKEFFKTSE